MILDATSAVSAVVLAWVVSTIFVVVIARDLLRQHPAHSPNLLLHQVLLVAQTYQFLSAHVSMKHLPSLLRLDHSAQ